MEKTILIVGKKCPELDETFDKLSLYYKILYTEEIPLTLSNFKPEISLIIFDINISGLSYIEFCEFLKFQEEAQDIPILFLMEKIDNGEIVKDFVVGNKFIYKPISYSLLRVKIAKSLYSFNLEEVEKSFHRALYVIGEISQMKRLYSNHNIWRMAEFTYILAIAIGWSREKSKSLELSTLIHDIGMISIDESVYQTTEELTEEAKRLTRRHTIYGHKILSGTNSPLFQLAAEVALYHHERWDGKGYPKGLAGEKIPEAARIISVVDVLDNLLNERSNKKAYPFNDSVNYILDRKGTQFDPEIIEIFESVIPEFKDVYEKWESAREKEFIN
ncbi:MAG: HD domain-containing protein [Leptospiraceae bacterium]|nr:HD domain-containing protein [Leptospiraceae bacterium]